jgi:hypothetical protein
MPISTPVSSEPRTNSKRPSQLAAFGDECIPPHSTTQEFLNVDATPIFEQFRDSAVDAIELVACIYYDASQHRNESLLDVASDRFLEVNDTILKAKSIWLEPSPIRRYLACTTKIFFDTRKKQGCRLDGSCYHEVAINVAEDCLIACEDGLSADSYCQRLKAFSSQELVTDYLKSLATEIKCECQSGIERFTNAVDRVAVVQSISADDDVQGPDEPGRFNGGKMVFHVDRVELCGVEICSGTQAKRTRATLELLAKKDKDGMFLAYSCKDLAESVGIPPGEADATKREISAAGHIRHLRVRITTALRKEANISCGDGDVILSGGRGYRFAESLSVQFVDEPTITDITDINDSPDVPNVLKVRNKEATSRRAWIVQQLKNGVELKAPTVATQFKRSIKTALRDLEALRDEGKIEYVGDPRTGFYRICATPPSEK